MGSLKLVDVVDTGYCTAVTRIEAVADIAELESRETVMVALLLEIGVTIPFSTVHTVVSEEFHEIGAEVYDGVNVC